MKAYLIKVEITEIDTPISDPVTEMTVPTLGFKVKLKGKDYGTLMYCTDANKLEVIPYYLKEYLELIIEEEKNNA